MQRSREAEISENDISAIILDVSVRLHSRYGPGLYESVYEEVLAYELLKRNLIIQRQLGIPVIHEEIKLDIGFRADLIIENKVLVEIKSVQL